MTKPLSAATRLMTADRDMTDELGMSPALYQSVNYRARDETHFAELAAAPLRDDFYARSGNPTAARLVKVIADLEGGETGMIFASGMAAATAAIMSQVKSGDHIVAQRNHYIGVTKLLTGLLPDFGVEITLVDQRSVDDFAKAMRPNTRLVTLETPVNPMMHITDLAAVCELARAHGAVTFCDNTFATPINQRPIEQGVDIVMHSATKYIGGHHDLLAGTLTASRQIMERIWDLSIVTGGIGAPFNAWLALRGIRTLALRVRRQNDSALAIARFLENHPSVRRVFYPGLASHPQHDLARRQMSGFGGLLTFDLVGGYDAGTRFLRKLKLVSNAASLGGVASVAIQPAVLFGGRLSAEAVESQGITPGLIRFAAGIEDAQDLIDDIGQALEPS